MKIEFLNISKNGSTLKLFYRQEGLSEVLDERLIPTIEYPQPIESVPDSIAVIPFLANLLPISFVLDFPIYVNEIDRSFYDSIEKYRKAYQEMVPCIEFGGGVFARKIVDNQYETSKTCLLFSGGIDATNSLCVNEKRLDDCITIWGSDIGVSNVDGWNKMYSNIHRIVEAYGKRPLVIKSNFREYINEKELNRCVNKSGDNWWHGFQHGIALLGHVAPLAFCNGYGKILIASSFTADYRPICASDPRTDSCFSVGPTATIHDGYEFDRCDKILNIAKSISEKGIAVPLHVCWENTSGDNCGMCEKCLRSYLGCLCVGVDPSRLGIVSRFNGKQIKLFYMKYVDCESSQVYKFAVFRKHIENTFGDNCPKDLKWIQSFKVERVNHSFFRRAFRIYCKVRKAFKKA